MAKLTAVALNCSLKRGSEPSSTQRLLDEVAAALKAHDVSCETVRLADHDVKPGVRTDEGEGDAWPALRQRILSAQILVVGTPIWLGQPSSIAKRALERLDALLGDKDDAGRTPAYGIVAIAAVVGNEDGAHHSGGQILQGLNEVGFTVPASAVTYWVGEAMGSVNYIDLPESPENTANATRMAASNAAHLARLLHGARYPGRSGG